MNYAWKDPDEFKELDERRRGPRGPDAREDRGDEEEDPELRDGALRRRRQEGLEQGPLLDAAAAGRLADVPRPQLRGRLLPGARVHEGQRRRLLPQQLLLHEQRRPDSSTRPDDPDKFFMGPIWDFDRSAGAKPSGVDHDHLAHRLVGARPRLAEPRHEQDPLVHPHRQGPAVPEGPARSLGGQAGGVRRRVAPTGIDDAAARLWAAPTDYDLGKQVAANDRAVWESSGSRYAPHSPRPTTARSPGSGTGTPIATRGWTRSSSRRLRPSRTEGSGIP